MIAIDDMRPELSIYGYDHMHTPNMERLANRSIVFERAYVQVALCMPSRTALLTSRRPDTTKDWTISPKVGRSTDLRASKANQGGRGALCNAA